MSVLDEIILGVRQDLAARRGSMNHILEAVAKAGTAKDSLSALRGEQMHVIAEVKRSSPSKGNLAKISARGSGGSAPALAWAAI